MTRQPQMRRGALVAAALTVACASIVTLPSNTPLTAAAPSAIAVDFVGRATSMGTAEMAGAVPRARWNAATGTNRSAPLSLVNEAGAWSGATLTWSSEATGTTPAADQPGNSRLMKGYIEGQGSRSARVSVAGLMTSTYDVYVYVDGSNGSVARSASYRVSGPGITMAAVTAIDSANATFGGTFTQANNSAGNYVRFRITASGFTLTATPSSSSNGTGRAPINGIQVVPVPPATYRVAGTIGPLPAGAGVTVNVGGASTATTVTDASGGFSIGGLAPGSYSVMPSKPGHTFTPTSRMVTVSSSDVTGITFQAAQTPTTFSIRGTVNPGAGGSGTVLSLSGVVNATATANAQGIYAFSALPSGSYVVTPTKPGFAFTPSSTVVTIAASDATDVNFAPNGPTKARANAYDDGWESAWVNHGRALLATTGKTAGFVLQVGDSITFSRAYSTWAQYGAGRTAEDVEIMTWARAGSWSATNTDVTNKNGWYLAGADTTSRRAMTAAGGITAGEYVLGCCNSGPTMPATTNPTQARQHLVDGTYAGNLQIATVASAFGDAQFAVVMLGSNDPGNPTGLMDLASIVDALETARILPILSTIPPRSDALSNQLNVEFNDGVRALARQKSLPLIDYYQEILLRRPGSTWMDTLIAPDGLHPTGDRAGFTVASNPYATGGDPTIHMTGEAAANGGYLLRSWLTVQKLKEVKRFVIDGVNP